MKLTVLEGLLIIFFFEYLFSRLKFEITIQQAREGQKRKISNSQDLSPGSQIIPRKRRKENLSSAGRSRMLSMNRADDDCGEAYSSSARRDSILEESSDEYPAAEVLDVGRAQESPR